MPTSPAARPDPWQDPLDQLERTGSFPIEMFLTFQVNQLSSAFERQWARFMREKAGVSLSEWRILAMLQHGPRTFAHVVELTAMNKALAHRSARTLADLDLIGISDTPGDARSTTLALSAKGRKLLAKVLPLSMKRQKLFLSALSAAERQAFYSALGKLRSVALEWEPDK